MRMKKIIGSAAAVFAAVLTAASAHAAEWQTAVEENYDGWQSILNYTAYADGDPAEVGLAGCPNDDASEWSIVGIKYEGPNYGGYPDSGIRANITRYIKSGDKLRVSFSYRSPGYENLNFDVTPMVEVVNPDGTIKWQDELGVAPMGDVWKDYTREESEPVVFDGDDSVRLVLKNDRGFWHMKDLKIERYGETGDTETPFISELKMTINGTPAEALADGEIKISGKINGSADIYAALYKNGVLTEVKKQSASSAFEAAVNNEGADTMKLYAWDKMTPKSGTATITAEGISQPPPLPAQPTTAPDAIKDAYKDDFLIGSIYNPFNLNDKAQGDFLAKHFNAITGENAMKPDHTQPEKGKFTLEGKDPDLMMYFAREHNMTAIGHVLVWHQQTPAWFTPGTPQEVEENMKTHIGTVAGRYKGQLKGWDVVNEAIDDSVMWSWPTKWNEYIRKDVGDNQVSWYNAMGEDYLYKAYVYAHEADPDAELYYNDYNLDNRSKCEAAALLVEYINDRWKRENNTDENLIYAVGMQSHYDVNTKISGVRDSIDRFRQAGVHVNITELDVCLRAVGNNGEGTSDSVELTPILEQKQAAKYAELMALYRANSDIIDRVTFWGYSDGKSWRGGLHPLMFNDDLTPKQAYYAIMDPKDYR